MKYINSMRFDAIILKIADNDVFENTFQIVSTVGASASVAIVRATDCKPVAAIDFVENCDTTVLSIEPFEMDGYYRPLSKTFSFERTNDLDRINSINFSEVIDYILNLYNTQKLILGE